VKNLDKIIEKKSIEDVEKIVKIDLNKVLEKYWI
jgi:hypothetical protein